MLTPSVTPTGSGEPLSAVLSTMTFDTHLSSPPAALTALGDDCLVAYRRRFDPPSSSSIVRAKVLKDDVDAIIARQRLGFFTLEEAARLLKDSYGNLDSKHAITGFLKAHARGELTIYAGHSRFPIYAGEPVTTFYDLIKADELNCWLKVMKYEGVPQAGSNLPSGGDVCGPATAPKPRRRRRDDGLGPVFKIAEKNAGDGAPWMRAWAELEKLAKSKDRPAPLVGHVPDEGVKYMKYGSEESVEILSREAFKKRIERGNKSWGP
jgi:hypothetical protein